MKSIRVDLGLNQEEMAKKLGISLCAYQNKESGKAPLLARELMEISTLSKVAIEDIQIPK